MNGRKISALVVTSESGYLGIVTTTDVLEYALNSV
jgi:CBS domain-containing protein